MGREGRRGQGSTCWDAEEEEGLWAAVPRQRVSPVVLASHADGRGVLPLRGDDVSTHAALMRLHWDTLHQHQLQQHMPLSGTSCACYMLLGTGSHGFDHKVTELQTVTGMGRRSK